MNCEYCKNEFKTTSSLNNHKNKSKYCLIIQGKIEPKDKILSTKQEKIEEFKCEYCNKILSSKQYLERHMTNCKLKKKRENQNITSKINVLEIELNEKNKIIENLELQLKTNHIVPSLNHSNMPRWPAKCTAHIVEQKQWKHRKPHPITWMKHNESQ